MLLAATLVWITAVWAQAPRVTLDYGTFKGMNHGQRDIISFRGIRYADPPVGNLRFRAAVSPPSKHLGEVDATKFRHACIQDSRTRQSTSEDCLFGNVFIPTSTKSRELLPVLVWFHGGGFIRGNGNVRISDVEDFFKDSSKPFILVSFNYRLGQFGFLGGFGVAADGQMNAGLQDQRIALRWVQRYIERFGGDPHGVTIWGQSAGSASTMLHVLANNGNNEGLFRAAMGDSPALTFMPSSNDGYLEEIFRDLASNAKCHHTDSVAALDCLRSVDVSTLASAGRRVIRSRPSTIFLFTPYFDGKFITTRPVAGFQSGNFARVPVLFGSNTNEGARWSRNLSDPDANTSRPGASASTVYNFLRGQYPPLTRETFDRAIRLYPLADFGDSRDRQGQQMYGDMRYICTAGLITGGIATANVDAFQYHYNNRHLRSDHGSELGAFFRKTARANKDDRALFKEMRQLWTSFVTSGIPGSTRSTWPTTETQGRRRLRLDPTGTRPEIASAAQAERCAFWTSVSQEIDI